MWCPAIRYIACVPNYRADLKICVPSAVEMFVPNCTTSHPWRLWTLWFVWWTFFIVIFFQTAVQGLDLFLSEVLQCGMVPTAQGPWQRPEKRGGYIKPYGSIWASLCVFLSMHGKRGMLCRAILWKLGRLASTHKHCLTLKIKTLRSPETSIALTVDLNLRQHCCDNHRTRVVLP